MSALPHSQPPILAPHPVAPCLDLRAMFGSVFRFADDPGLEDERGNRRTIERAWLTRIPCAGDGFLAPAGGARLLAFTSTRRRRLKALSCVRIRQESADEVAADFDLADLETVAVALGAKRRRRLSAEHQRRLTAAGSKHRFSRLETARALEGGQEAA